MKTKYYEYILWFLILTFIEFILFSCTPLKRLERMERRHPYLFEQMADTITVTDTIEVVVPGRQIDTVFHYSRLIDTVTIEKDGLRTVIWMKNDTVSIRTSVDTVLIYVPYEKKVPVSKYKIYRRPRDRLIRALGVSVGAVISLFALWVLILYLRYKFRSK